MPRVESMTPTERKHPKVVNAILQPASKVGPGRIGAGIPAIFTVTEVSQATALTA